MSSYDDRLAAQRDRAIQLARHRECPHCGAPLSLLDALSIVRGSGVSYYVRVGLPSGDRTLIRERDFNPQTMVWADDEHDPARDSGA